MAQHHALGRAAGAGGVDEAGGVGALLRGDAARRPPRSSAAPMRQQLIPVEHRGFAGVAARSRSARCDIRSAASGLRPPPAGRGRPAPCVETIAPTAPLWSSTCAWSAIVLVVKAGTRDAARRHDREIGDGPFRPVLRHQRDAVARARDRCDQSPRASRRTVDAASP